MYDTRNNRGAVKSSSDPDSQDTNPAQGSQPSRGGAVYQGPQLYRDAVKIQDYYSKDPKKFLAVITNYARKNDISVVIPMGSTDEQQTVIFLNAILNNNDNGNNAAAITNGALTLTVRNIDGLKLTGLIKEVMNQVEHSAVKRSKSNKSGTNSYKRPDLPSVFFKEFTEAFLRG